MRNLSLRAALGLLLLGASLAFTACETPEVGPKSGKDKGGCGTPTGTSTNTGGAS